MHEPAHLGIPNDAGRVPLLDVLLQRVNELEVGLCPSDRSRIAALGQLHTPYCSARKSSGEKGHTTHVSLNCLITLSDQNCAAFFISATKGAGAGS